MKLRVQYTAQLRTAVGRAEDVVELPAGSSLASVIEHLTARLDSAAPHLLGPDGRLQPSLLIVVNGAAVAARDAASFSLQGDEVIILLPPIAGG